jgi:tellurite resistance protein TerC
MLLIWIGFLLFVLAMLALDLGVFHRKSHIVSIKEALSWSGVWIALGISFSIFIYFGYEGHWLGMGYLIDSADGVLNHGRTAAIKYLTGYVVEKSLSVDNIFVIAMIFNYFSVPAIYQHRVLFWGVLGALLLRGLMIGIGAALISQFHWILYLFGFFLIVTALKMLFLKTEETDPNQSIIVKWTRRLIPVTSHFHGEHFLVVAGSAASHESATPDAAVTSDSVVDQAKTGTKLLTPLALALIMVETTDLIFAVDSIPAIFAITADPFLVFTSNIFAILGLRSLYFALAGMMNTFKYLKPALALVLLVVGVKMLTVKWLKALLGEYFNFYLLAVVLLILATGVVASIIHKNKK